MDNPVITAVAAKMHELNKRAEALVQCIDKLDRLEKDFSKAKLEERGKLQQQINKFTAQLFMCSFHLRQGLLNYWCSELH